MIYLPPLRRLLLPAIILLIIIVFYRLRLLVPTSIHSFVIHPPPLSPPAIHIPIASLAQTPLPVTNASNNHLLPPKKYFYSYTPNTKPSNQSFNHAFSQSATDPSLDVLFKCSLQANPYTNHIRLPNIIQNISDIPPDAKGPDHRIFWNPTVISLPYWSENQYLLVSRIVTDGNYQENVLCEANICYVNADDARPGERPCTQDDINHVGPAGGMRCVSGPMPLSVPPTPAERCEGRFASYVDIPGFHDPRIFWSGKGEPLMMVNTQYLLALSPMTRVDYSGRSRYACFGLWMIDLRTLFPKLQTLLASHPTHPSLGPLKSYPTLTELTRNPVDTRSPMEKNWLLFFTASGESYLHYDLSDPHGGPRGRTFAKLLGSGLTTTNLTDPLEISCLRSDLVTRDDTWHQATNSLRLILCNRSDPSCTPGSHNTVFFAIVHRKFPNFLKLPLRYERHFLVWAATPPFAILGISKHPILLANETASGWLPSENWADDPLNVKKVMQTRDDGNATITETFGGKGFWAYFTYTVSISYAWGRQDDEPEAKNVGYLDDEVVLGIGIDDAGQGYARVKAGDLVQCLRACEGRRGEV